MRFLAWVPAINRWAIFWRPFGTPSAVERLVEREGLSPKSRRRGSCRSSIARFLIQPINPQVRAHMADHLPSTFLKSVGGRLSQAGVRVEDDQAVAAGAFVQHNWLGGLLLIHDVALAGIAVTKTVDLRGAGSAFHRLVAIKVARVVLAPDGIKSATRSATASGGRPSARRWRRFSSAGISRKVLRGCVARTAGMSCSSPFPVTGAVCVPVAIRSGRCRRRSG